LQDQKPIEEMQRERERERGRVDDAAAHPIIGTVHATSTSEKPFYPLAWLPGSRTSYR
jgi:predicted ABC-class ATPase